MYGWILGDRIRLYVVLGSLYGVCRLDVVNIDHALLTALVPVASKDPHFSGHHETSGRCILGLQIDSWPVIDPHRWLASHLLWATWINASSWLRLRWLWAHFRYGLHSMPQTTWRSNTHELIFWHCFTTSFFFDNLGMMLGSSYYQLYLISRKPALSHWTLPFTHSFIVSYAMQRQP